MDLSIVIVSWNVENFLQKCLFSIYQNQADLKLEVIVVDNNSSDETCEIIKQNFSQVSLICNQSNRGFAKACNQGLHQAKGKFLLLLNPDTEILDGCLVKMVEFMDKNPEVGLAGCKLLNPDGTNQPSVRNFPNFLVHFGMMFKLHHLITFTKYFANDFDYHQPNEAEQLMGAFIMIRQKAWQKIGDFDEKYYLWFEEVDYCYRARKLGIKVVYTPIAKIIHYGGRSFGQAGSLKKQFYFSLSRLHYIKKNSSWLTYAIILLLTPLSIVLSLLCGLIKKNAE
jgi:O-antigen biosynthesis protein